MKFLYKGLDSMKILGIDTSAVTVSCSVCEVDGNPSVIAEGLLHTKRVHSQTLIPFLESMLTNADVALSEIGAFAVSVGPGSFTGLRIGVSAVKGMAYALGKPCRAVSTLSALAYNFTATDAVVCAAMDARRNQVYNALFRVSGGKVERLCDDRAVSAKELRAELERFDEKIILAGDGAELVYRETGVGTLAPPQLRFQSGTGVCFAAQPLPDTSAAALMPVYLRLPQAERERKARLLQKSADSAGEKGEA